MKSRFNVEKIMLSKNHPIWASYVNNHQFGYYMSTRVILTGYVVTVSHSSSPKSLIRRTILIYGKFKSVGA